MRVTARFSFNFSQTNLEVSLFLRVYLLQSLDQFLRRRHSGSGIANDPVLVHDDYSSVRDEPEDSFNFERLRYMEAFIDHQRKI